MRIRKLDQAEEDSHRKQQHEKLVIFRSLFRRGVVIHKKGEQAAHSKYGNHSPGGFQSNNVTEILTTRSQKHQRGKHNKKNGKNATRTATKLCRFDDQQYC